MIQRRCDRVPEIKSMARAYEKFGSEDALIPFVVHRAINSEIETQNDFNMELELKLND